NPTTWEFNASTGRCMAGEWTLMLGFKTKFNNDHTWSENHVLHKVAVSRGRNDKLPSELLPEGLPPLHKPSPNLRHYIFRVVRHNAILVRSSPRVVVLIDKRFDVNSRPECRRSRHGSLLRSLYCTPDARGVRQLRLGLA